MIFLQKLTYGQTWSEVEMLSHLKTYRIVIFLGLILEYAVDL